jgi:aryl-phospho-beta-D-glucosidase BglC (GH1 family)
MKLCRALLVLLLAWCAAANAASPPTLEQRMQLFRDGSLRGFALNELPESGVSVYTEKDYRDLVATGANVVRVSIQLKRCPGCTAYSTPLADIAYARSVLAKGNRYGFRVVVVLLATPWGDQSDYWQSAALKASIVRQWRNVALRLKAYPALVGYDLINEPVVTGTLTPPATAQSTWLALATSIARTLRAADPQTPIIVESQPWALAFPFYSFGPPMPADITGVVYSFHMYDPHEFTNQGLPGYPLGVPYPNPASGWDKNGLVWDMEGVRQFALANNAPVMVGEFSCLRWIGPQCTQYLSDVISLFEARRWSWIYHCWRCWQGWDAEIPSNVAQWDPAAAAYRTPNTPTMQLLRQSMNRAAPPTRALPPSRLKAQFD